MSIPAARPLLSATSVAKRFGATTVLDGAGLSVGSGDAVALVGENGAGKSTFLKILAGLLPPDRGTVSVAGRVGYCPQDPGVLDLLSAEEHLAFFGAGLGLGRGEAVARGRAILAEFGFPLGERRVARHMSGGTLQKLNLALALLGDPEVLLLDEPYQGFDAGTYVNFWDHVATWTGEGRAVVVVTHMLAELDRVDRVVEVTVHPSRLEAVPA